MSNEKEERSLRQKYGEVIAGYSLYKYKDKNIFIKHFSTIDQLDQDFIYLDYFDKATSRGFPTEEESINQLKKDNVWPADLDSIIENITSSIKSLYASKKKAFRQADFDSINSQIKEQEQILEDKVRERIRLIGSTAEQFAQRLTNANLIFHNLYKDRTLTKRLFKKEEFDNLDTEQEEEIYNLYYTITRSLSENNIKKIALSPFFQNVFVLAENLYQFFGRALIKLTTYQIQLCAYGNFYKNILSGEPKPPEDIAIDPDKLEDWYFGQAHVSEMLKKVDKDGGGSLVGLSDKDKEFLGIDNSHERVDMKKKLRESGGELSMKDLMDIEGIK